MMGCKVSPQEVCREENDLGGIVGTGKPLENVLRPESRQGV